MDYSQNCWNVPNCIQESRTVDWWQSDEPEDSLVDATGKNSEIFESRYGDAVAEDTSFVKLSLNLATWQN